MIVQKLSDGTYRVKDGMERKHKEYKNTITRQEAAKLVKKMPTAELMRINAERVHVPGNLWAEAMKELQNRNK